MKRFKFVSILVALSLLLVACAPAANPAPTQVPNMPKPIATPMPEPAATEAPKTIVDIAVSDGRFTALVAALQAADLDETLQGAGTFSVFAPTVEAFAKLPVGTLEI